MASAPPPPPAMASAAAPAVGVEDESARDQNNKVVLASEDVSIGDGDLPVPCSEPSGGSEVAPEPVENKGGDTTESSSSFGDTFSGFGDEADDGELEVTSHAQAPTDDDGASTLPRRKKVTAEWRNGIRPMMWKFQWLQLRMKDLSSQVARYDRELALIEKEKELHQAVSKTNGSMPEVSKTNGSMPEVSKANDSMPEVSKANGSMPEVSKANGSMPEVSKANGSMPDVSKTNGSMPEVSKTNGSMPEASKTNGSMPDAMLIGKDHRNTIMERRRRKRHEDIVDTSLYIKKHPILSHYNDKQIKGVETDGVLLDDDCSGPGDTVALLDAEEYDTIFEQVSLKDILSTIDGVQSRVHLLQDRLNKAHLQEDNLASSEDNTQVRVPRKRQSTQRFGDTSYMKYQNTKSQKNRNCKPQKRKNLNVLLKDDDGPALTVKPDPGGGTNGRIEDAEGNSGGKSGKLNPSQNRAIAMDLLLGVDNALPNGHMGDLCKENADDILIDNQTVNEGCPQFEKIEHLPSEASSKGQNTSAPVEVKKTSAPLKIDGISPQLEVDSTSAIVFNQEPLLEKSPMLKPVKKRDWKPRERKSVWGSASSSMNHSKGASTISDSEQKSKDVPPSSKEKTESTLTAPMDPDIMTPLAAWKKRKAGNKSAVAEEHKVGNLSSKKQETGTSAGNKTAAAEEHNSATKKRKTENSLSAAKKQENENSSPAAKTLETESTASKLSTQSPSNLRVEKAVLVAVNSRRSQRVRKPKVY